MSWFNPNPPRSPHRSSSYSQHDSRPHHQPSSQHDSRPHHQPSSGSKGYYYSTSSRGSSSRARSRSGYINVMVSKIRRYLRRLMDYARRHPMKLLMMILPLLTGGALAGILAKFGIRLPRGLENIVGGGRSHAGMGGSGLGGAGGVQGLIKIAQQFM